MHFLSSPLSVCLQFILVLFYYHRELRKKKGFHLTLLILPHTHPPIENCVCMRLHKNLETSRPVVPNLESAESVLGVNELNSKFRIHTRISISKRVHGKTHLNGWQSQF